MADTRTTSWETVKKLTLELDAQADADIIRQLESRDSAGEYVKRLIREDIAGSGRNPGRPSPVINADVINDAEKNFDAILSILKKVVTK